MTDTAPTTKLKLASEAGGNRNRKLLSGILASCLLTCLVFAVIELRYPFFFTSDDNADWYASEYTYVIRTILSGKFPMYSFTQFCGQRFFANGQSGVLNPFVYLAALLSRLFFSDYHAIIDVLALLMMVTGTAGAYLLLERLGACHGAAIAGAVAWNINTYNVWVGNSWILVITTTGILPFIFYGSIRLCSKPSVGNYLWAILPKVFLFYNGHPQFFFYAALFDCLYAGMYVFLGSGKGRFKALLKTIGRYVIVYIAVVILVLPQLIPQYQMIGLTSQGQALSFEDFTIESDSLMMGIFWPFLYLDTKVFAIDPFFGYPLLIFACAGIYLPATILTAEKEKILRHKKLLFNMFAAFPAMIIAFLSNYSESFQHLLHKLPIINRFHFLHRNILYLTALAVIFASLSCTLFWRYYCENRKDGKKITVRSARIAGIVFVLLEVINMTLVFVLQPQRSRGPVYRVEEGYSTEYASLFSEGRYLCVGYGLDPSADSNGKEDLAHCLRYNLASYYGISNISGYYGVYTNDGIGKNRTFFKKVIRFTGDIWHHYPGFIDEMRSQSVCWYIVNPARRDKFEPLFKENGFTKVREDEYGIVYFDPECEPLAFDEQGKKVSLEQGEVNNLKLNTDESFKGGTITLNYSFDSNFKCFIDGKETPITDDSANWQMKISCPQGAHEIEIRYVDRAFTASLAVAGAFVILSVAVIAVFKYSEKRRTSGKVS